MVSVEQLKKVLRVFSKYDKDVLSEKILVSEGECTEEDLKWMAGMNYISDAQYKDVIAEDEALDGNYFITKVGMQALVDFKTTDEKAKSMGKAEAVPVPVDELREEVADTLPAGVKSVRAFATDDGMLFKLMSEASKWINTKDLLRNSHTLCNSPMLAPEDVTDWVDANAELLRKYLAE